MDPNAVVLEISSDEDVGWNEHNGRGTADGGDDHVWLSEILDEVNKRSLGDDSDDVVVVSEVSPSAKSGKKSKLKSSLLDLDDDCVILDKDPDKPVEVLNDKPSNVEDDSDDIVVVSEKGQVACRDYPHPRHLCIKFPFSTTPNQSHCDQCYCYVCDSLAPCVYWGNGSSTTDHCHATDKDELWKHHRKTAKKGSKPVPPLPTIADVAQFNGLHIHRPPLPMAQPSVRPGSIRSHHQSPNFRPANNIITQNRRPVFPSRGKVHQDLFHQYMAAKSNCNSGLAGFRSSLASSFKRTGSVGAVATAHNRHHPYVPRRGSSVNSIKQQIYNQVFSQPNPVVNQHINSSSPFSNYQNHPNPNTQSQPQFSNYQNPNHSSQFHQTHSVTPSTQPGQASYPVHANPPSYPAPSQTNVVDTPSISVSDYSLPNQGTQAKGNGPSWPTNEGTQAKGNGLSWPTNEGTQAKGNGLSWPTNEGTQAKDNGLNWPTIEGSGPVNELSSMPVELGEYQYDWMFDSQPVEPEFVDGPTDFLSDSSIFDF